MIGNRISEIRGKIPRSDFAKTLNIHPNTLGRYEKGERLPDSSFLESLIENYNVSASWLLTGNDDGVKRDIATYTKSSPGECTKCSDLIFIPRVKAKLSAGHGSLLTGSKIVAQYSFHSKWLHSIGQPASMVILFVTGSSMQPEIYDNDMVMIDQSQTEILAGRMYAVGVDDTILVKYVDIEPGCIILRSENERYQPIKIPKDQQNTVRILGRVIWSARVY